MHSSPSEPLEPTEPLDLSATDKPNQIQENLIAYMRLFAGLPGMVMADEPESFWFVSNQRAPGNVVLRTRWPDGSDGADGSGGEGERIEARIEETLARIGSHTG